MNCYGHCVERKKGAIVESVDRALVLLLRLGRSKRVTVTEAAHELGVAPSTAHRLLQTLCERGFATREDDRSYRPGPELFAPGSRATQRLATLRSAAWPHLTRLNAELGETSHLMSLVGPDVRFADGVEAPHTLRIGLRIGHRMSAYRTSGGKAILAELPDREVRTIYRDGLPASPEAISTVDELLRELDRIRVTGYGVNHNESEAGVSALGLCITPRDSPMMAAVSVAVPSTRCDSRAEARIAEALLAVAPAVRASVRAAIGEDGA